MKRALLTFGIAAASFASLAQNGTSIQSPTNTVLYRGYENKVVIKVDPLEDRVIQLKGENVTITPDNDRYTYNVKPANAVRTSTLEVYAVDGSKIETLQKVEYTIQNLPDPEVYWGGVKTGGKADLKSTELSVRYPAGVLLPNEFTIQSWEIYTKDETVTGNGHDVSSAKQFLEKLEAGTTLIFTVRILSPNGVTRLKKAQWTV